jgi:hypothetical protein
MLVDWVSMLTTQTQLTYDEVVAQIIWDLVQEGEA